MLREYALIADGERGALIGPRGDISWLCAPHWHSDAVLSSLIGGRGVYMVTPVERFVWGGFYEAGTLIWHSRWITDTDAVIECSEALAFPGDPRRVVVLRRLIAQRGEAKLEVRLDLAAHFGHAPLRDPRREPGGRWVGRTGPLQVRWTGAADAQPTPDSGLCMRLSLARGHRHDLVLELGERLPREPPDSETAWCETEAAWRRAVPEPRRTIAPRDARHAYAVLRGLTASQGGMVAAATTSLPERADRGRNYDYRYVWIRDQCFAAQAVAADGPHPLLDDAVRFVTERILADGPHLKPAYTISGDPVPRQRSLDLPGYPGGTDIVGNHVTDQFQLDAFGEALLLLAAAAGHDLLDAQRYRAATIAIGAIRRRWRQPDAGLWELDNQHWTHSRLICAAGLRQLASATVAAADAAAWNVLADQILAATAADSLHPSGRWQRTPRDPRVDAALLLPGIRGALPPDDPRTVATTAAVARELASDGYVYRFRHDNRPLSDAEGAFMLCGFSMALAAHQQGDHRAAARWFERGRAACGPPGLFSEEYDVAQRQLRGNLPQAFVHAVMLEASIRLAFALSEDGFAERGETGPVSRSQRDPECAPG